MKTFIAVLTLITSFACTAQKQGESIAKDLNTTAFAAKIDATPQAQILDVRTPEEWSQGIIEGAHKINWFGETFDAEVKKLDPSKPVLVYCASGGRSAKAMKKLSNMGFTEVYNLEGGMGAWKSAENKTVQ